VLPGFALAYLIAGRRSLKGRLGDLLLAGAAVVVSAGWYLALVELWPPSSRPYIGGSQHNSILELALGYNGLGRLTGDEVGGLGNLNHDVGWARLFGLGMGLDIAWLLPAAAICVVAGLLIVRRAPRTDPTRAALTQWGTWLVVTAAVFSFANGIVHPYYTVALAPAIAASVGIGATLLWRNRFDIRAATALAATVLVTAVLAAVLLGRNTEWLPWLRALVAVGGVGAAVLIPVAGRLSPVLARAVAALAAVACVLAPAAYSIATAATPHTGAVPSVGPSRHGAFGGPGGLLDAPETTTAVADTLAAHATEFTWAAATVGSNNAAGYQLASGVPVMAVGGFNGTDPAPTLKQFQAYVAGRRIHYFIAGHMMPGPARAHATGSRDAEDIAEWVQTHFTPADVDGAVLYDLTRPSANS
jgi:4-amino-4-deoxy-L-arabinose transferase-like glycosyltransferase